MINEFIKELQAAPPGAVFNPWWQWDKENDIDESAPEIRRQHLRAFVTERLGKVKYLLVAEALGYQGGHFSGIPMTSERILLGYFKHIQPHQIIQVKPQRTSKVAIKANGFTEPTATVVWGQIMTHHLDAREVILWNAFPWHPYDPWKGCLSNRTPSEDEMRTGRRLLSKLIDLVNPQQIFAIGKKAEQQLRKLEKIPVPYPLRHPARGGAQQFRRQFAEYFGGRGI